jgi:hypothetical protein
VKDFLMTKLKETEAALKQCTDEKELAKRQAASDQEVITFLDARTQEMEKVAAEAMNKVYHAFKYAIHMYTLVHNAQVDVMMVVIGCSNDALYATVL